ncbi:Type VI secretion lipoprotein, family [Pseudomonas cichorii]|uniref:Type VI secretion lipoprotein, family n=1 Tax=Pseudomonas cichorii TaxID=36746 RepID=A0A3M4LP91_PSECI|nr:type VI secretion system lipoprotein TssJ [Pseudomonas cichorii]RMQ43307.1 Type VI secretion lipoprotein, family [Pseudomonas cichorii]
MLRLKSPIMLTVLLALGSCSTLSPYSTQTRLSLQLTASETLNPDINGRSSPIVLRLLELRQPVAFENLDFFSLYGRARESLNHDLVASEERELQPGQRVLLKLKAGKGSHYVGILAAYRNLPEARWRHVIPLMAEGHTRTELTLDENGIHRSDEHQPERMTGHE